MTYKMACTSTCGWIGSEDSVEWGMDTDDMSQDEVMLCPDCMATVRRATFWLLIRVDGGMYRGTGTCEAPTIEDAAEYAEEHYTNSLADLGGVCDIFGPFDDIPKSAI